MLRTIGEDIPRADIDLPLAGEGGDLFAVFGADLEVILHDDGLAVGREGALEPTGVESVDQAIHELHEPIAVILEGFVPFTIPMGTEDIISGAGHSRG
jgi:hypothetical protein